jgi:xanthine dehydrogenase YagT iron-sulfur-binding subunit
MTEPDDLPDDGDDIFEGDLHPDKQTRREFLINAAAVGSGLAFGTLMAESADASDGAAGADNKVQVVQAVAPERSIPIRLKVNGQERNLDIDPRSSLLDVLRESLDLIGTKKGCDHGQCGACTVLVEGKRINSCLTFAIMYQGRKITTVEGLGHGDKLDPMQAAFIEHDGFQCGYCTPGQICSAVAMLEEFKRGRVSQATDSIADCSKKLVLNDLEIRERMSGNICRCGAYPGIVAAIKEVAGV